MYDHERGVAIEVGDHNIGDVGLIRGTLIRKMPDGVYEFWDPFNRISLLVTTETEFTSKGRFSLYVRKSNPHPMTTKDGFTKKIPVYVESKEAERKVKEWVERFKQGEERMLKKWEQLEGKIPALKKERRQAYKRLRNMARSMGLSMAKNPPELKRLSAIRPDVVMISMD